MDFRQVATNFSTFRIMFMIFFICSGYLAFWLNYRGSPLGFKYLAYCKNSFEFLPGQGCMPCMANQRNSSLKLHLLVHHIQTIPSSIFSSLFAIASFGKKDICSYLHFPKYLQGPSEIILSWKCIIPVTIQETESQSGQGPWRSSSPTPCSRQDTLYILSNGCPVYS